MLQNIMLFISRLFNLLEIVELALFGVFECGKRSVIKLMCSQQGLLFAGLSRLRHLWDELGLKHDLRFLM